MRLSIWTGDVLMPTLWGRDYTRAELMARVGDLSQVGGVREYRLEGGSGDGVEAVDFDTGSGLRFTVLPGRALDISSASYRGIPLAFRTPTGDVQGARYEPGGQGWIRTTVLGLLVTGGLTNVGDPVEEDDDEAGAEGLHGRLSNLGATNVWADGAWDGDEYRMWVQGRVRQAILYGENLELVRRIETALGSSSIEIHDTVTNHGHRTQHMMILYHMNPGHPLLDEGARFHVRSQSRRFHDVYQGASKEGWEVYEGPSVDWQVQVLIHDVEAGADGTVHAALVNRGLGDGLGLGFTWNKNQLPYLNHWRNTTPGDYVTGIEPGNATVLGRARNRADGTLHSLGPGGTASFDVCIQVLDGADAIDEFLALVGA